MPVNFEEELKRLEVARRALGWSDEEYRRRRTALEQRIQSDRSAQPTSRPGTWTSDGTRSGGGHRLPPREDLLVAPYRFVEVVDAVALPPQSVRGSLQAANLLSEPLADGFCGEIEVEWAAETPLLIGYQDRDNSEVVPLTKGKTKDKGEKRDWWVPGASLRGMLRAAAEIVGYGRLEQTNRDFVFPLRDFEHPHYNDPRGEYGGWPIARASAVKGGWLHFDEAKDAYFIEPSELAYVEIDDLLRAGLLGSEIRRRTDWVELPLTRKYQLAGMVKGKQIDFSTVQGFAAAATDAQSRRRVRPQKEGAIEGTLVFSGPVPRGARDPRREKKVEYVLLTRPGERSAERQELSPAAWKRFELVNSRPGRDERTPDGSWAILHPVIHNSNRPIPVFFVGNHRHPQPDDFAFGLTRLFKVPHMHRQGDMIERMKAHALPKGDDKTYRPDLVGALFGFVQEPELLGRKKENSQQHDLALKGRIAFSGAVINEKDATCTDAIETIMAAPRASFAPFYLAGEVKDWSSDRTDTRIAGRKRYLPRESQPGDPAQALASLRGRLANQQSALSERARDNPDIKSWLRFLVPKSGKELRFKSRIRLHNVTPEEVGLVLFALTFNGDPEKRYRHLLGRAKPFGAGQLRVVSARLALKPNSTKYEADLVPPRSTELAGPEREGVCPAAADGKSSHSHRPFLRAFADYMRDERNFEGSVKDLVCRDFLETPSVRGFFGTASPHEGAQLREPNGEAYLRLRMTDRVSNRTINPFNELRRATKLPRPGAAQPALGWRVLLPAPARKVPKS